MNAHKRMPPMSLYEDTFEHARAMYGELKALEASMGAEPCAALHAAMWAAVRAISEHLGTTPHSILGEAFRSGGTGGGKEEDSTP